MSSDSSAFGCLPLAVRDSILQQAFQQLDQRHLCGVAPRVCRLFRQLSLSITTSLSVRLQSEDAAEQFSLWMQNHGAGLGSLVLVIDEDGRLVLHSLAAAEQLRSLTLSTGRLSLEVKLDAPFYTLTNLTRLSISGFYPTDPVLDSLLGLTRLHSFSLNRWQLQSMVDHLWEPFMEELATSLVALTYLDFSETPVEVNGLIKLRNLPNLRELLVDEHFPAARLFELDALPILSISARVEENTLGHLAPWLWGNSVSRLQKLVFRGPLQGPIPETVHGFPLQLATQLHTLLIEDIQLRPVHMEAITQLTQLTTLRIWHCGLDDAAVCELSVFSILSLLDLKGNSGIKGAQGSMEELARSMPQLEVLYLGGTSGGALNAARAAFGTRVVGFDRQVGAFNLRVS